MQVTLRERGYKGAIYQTHGAVTQDVIRIGGKAMEGAVFAAGPVVVDVRNTASGGELFRVRVGPWNSREEADSARRTLVSLGYGETIVAAR